MVGYTNRAFARFSVEGFKTNAMYGLLKLFNRKDVSLDDTWVFAFDRFSAKKANSDTYKANRPSAPNEYLLQSEQCEIGLRNSGFNVFAYNGLEADDIIASLCENHYNDFDKIRIFSNDKDMAQLIDKEGKIELVGLLSNSVTITKDNFADNLYSRKYIPFNTLLLYKSLVGDSSDEIKGIRGFGDAAFRNFLVQLEDDGYILEDIRAKEQELEILHRYFAGEKLEQALESHHLARFVTTKAIKLQNLEFQTERFSEFLSQFRMKSVAKATGVPYIENFNTSYLHELTGRYNEDFYKSKYPDGISVEIEIDGIDKEYLY